MENALYIIFGIVIGFILRHFFIRTSKSDDSEYVESISQEDVHDSSMLKQKPKVKEGHCPPEYYAYNGGWANVNQCKSCGLIALYEDMHTVNPCINCGGTVINLQTACKWGEEDGQKQWIKSKAV